MAHAKKILTNTEDVVRLIRPETDLELRLLLTPEFEKGMLWGEPRFGHPEGKVVLHVREVLDNIDLRHADDAELRRQLRLIAIGHDTFKYKEDRSQPRDWGKHHGVIAQQFMERYLSDQTILDVIETHDDAFYAWLSERRDDDYLQRKTLDRLFERIGYCLPLYVSFFECDTLTGDKTLAPIKWFSQKVEEWEGKERRD